MSDFDAALERLVSEPAFREALAADPQRALAGYQLSPDEWDVLTSQVDTGSGGQRHVEQRTSKASLFGLMSPMSGMGGFLSDDPGTTSGASFGAGGRSGASFGTDAPPGGQSGASFGTDAQSGASFGTDAQSDGQSGASFGGDDYRARPGGPGLGSAMGRAGEYMGAGGTDEPPPGPVYDNEGQLYQTRVDANGDGRWDAFTTTDRGERGVDLGVDRDGDGRVDWVGHDLDRDGLIDEASVDHDNDGVLETRWVDRDGDGWLDARQPWENGGPPPPEGPPVEYGSSAGSIHDAADAPVDPGPNQRGTAQEPRYDSQHGYIARHGGPE